MLTSKQADRTHCFNSTAQNRVDPARVDWFKHGNPLVDDAHLCHPVNAQTIYLPQWPVKVFRHTYLLYFRLNFGQLIFLKRLALNIAQ
jgi:hypothetical protein